MMFIVLGLDSQISLCNPQASPPPRQSETRKVAKLSDAVVDAPRLIQMGSIQKQRCNYTLDECAEE